MIGIYCLKTQNSFYCNRGDTFTLPITIYNDDKLQPQIYILQPNDTLYIGIRELNQSFENSIIRKKLTYENIIDNELYLTIDSEDTENLLTGKYILEIKLKSLINDKVKVTTVLPSTEFFITGSNKEPVTIYNDSGPSDTHGGIWEDI